MTNDETGIWVFRHYADDLRVYVNQPCRRPQSEKQPLQLDRADDTLPLCIFQKGT